MNSFLLQTLCYCLAGFTFASQAQAEHQSDLERNGYLGISLGSGDYDDDGLYDSMKVDDSNSAIKLFGGYRFSPHFSIEGSFTSFGELETYNSQVNIDGNFSALIVSFVGEIPTESGFSFQARAGVGFVSVYQEIHYISSSVTLIKDDESDTAGAFLTGTSVMYTPHSLKKISFLLGWERYYYSVDVITAQGNQPYIDDGDQEIDSYYLGFRYNF